IESTSYDGIGIIKVFFQPTVTISTAVAQITAISQTILRQLPPGTTPPLIIQYSASDVPVLQYGVGGDGISEQQAADIALNQLRQAGWHSQRADGPSKKWQRFYAQRGGGSKTGDG